MYISQKWKNRWAMKLKWMIVVVAIGVSLFTVGRHNKNCICTKIKAEL